MQIPDRGGEGTVRHSIGGVYEKLDEYENALEYYNDALAIKLELGDLASAWATLERIVDVHFIQRRYVLALDDLDRALVIARQIDDDQLREGQVLHNMGRVHFERGEYTVALEYYDQALEIRQRVDQANAGITLNNIGRVYEAQGKYGEALAAFEQAISFHRQFNDRLEEGTTLNNIGAVRYDLGQYDQSLVYYNAALAIAVELKDRLGEAVAHNNIGLVHNDVGNYPVALEAYNQALTIYREEDELDSQGNTLHNMGLTYDNLGDREEALNLYLQTLEIRRAVGDRAGEGITLDTIGTVYHELAQYSMALEYYTEALAIHQDMGNLVNEAFTLGNRGHTYEKRGQLENAIADYQAAVIVITRILNDASLNSAIAGLTNQRQNTWPFRRLAVLLTEQGDFASALNYAERGRAILTRTELTTGLIDFRAGLDEALLEHEIELRLAVTDAQNLVVSFDRDMNASKPDIEKARDELDAARTAYNQHLERMQLEGGYLAREVSFAVASPDDMRAILPEGTTLLVYSIGPASDLKSSIVFLITNDELNAVVLDTNAQTIKTQVDAFATTRQHTDVDELNNLYNLVIAPIESKLLDTSRLIIAPDGPLNYVPFAALQANDGKYLIDTYAISMIPSGTALVLLNERAQQTQPAPTSPALVLAQRDAPGLPRLRNAQTEAENIATALGVMAVTDASERDLRVGSTGAEVIHISAHAELNRFAPLFSVIHLGEDDSYDGRVEVREIYELDLSQGTELVILSGCETASGGDGEDFGLLSRAFFAAGADQVVASLWNVDDAATADLLTSFIKAREYTDNHAEALQIAMIATREQYPEPHYWASFVLYGLP